MFDKRKIFYFMSLIGTMFLVTNALAVDVPIEDFPVESFEQNVYHYLPKNAQDHQKPLMTSDYQARQLQNFYQHYYSSDSNGLSPWSASWVSEILPTVSETEIDILNDFDNRFKDDDHKHYGENFKAHDEKWLNQIRNNMPLESLTNLTFNPANRAIAVNNTHARALPDQSPDFYHFTKAGQGFPFDNLQESAIWAGTPLYVVCLSNDKSWSLVLTPDGYFAWVNSNDVASVSSAFMMRWQKAAKTGMVAVTKTNASVVTQRGLFQFNGYIGAVYPLAYKKNQDISFLIPVKNKRGFASITTAKTTDDSVTKMPLKATKQNMAGLIQQLQNRPYGWGGAFFFNDCSQELKSLFTPFGIWLPRNSSKQALMGRVVDLSDKSPSERIHFLKQHGHPLTTIIFIGGHVMLYVGNEQEDKQSGDVITYQNLWGLTTPQYDKRYIVGQSAFIPLLQNYTGFSEVQSLADKKYFKLIYVDELSHAPSIAKLLASNI